MSNGNGPILKDCPSPIEFGTLELPPDPDKTVEAAPSPMLESLDTPTGIVGNDQRSRETRQNPKLRPLRLQDAEVTARLERRIEIARRARTRMATKPGGEKNKKPGIGLLKNPYYPYEGGPLTRIMTFLANILKFIEQLILGRLEKAPTIIPRRKQIPEKKDEGPNTLISPEEQLLRAKKKKKSLDSDHE